MRKSIYGRQLGIDDNNNIVGSGRASALIVTAAAGSANISNVTLQVVDFEDAPVAGVRNLNVWLSDSTSGIGLTATTASGTVTATTGTDFFDQVAKKAKIIQTDATGKIVLAITDTAKTAFKVCYQMSEGGGAKVGVTLATGNYG